jgi:hypothetical protein
MPPSKQSGTKDLEMKEFKHLQKNYLERKNKEDKERLITFAVGKKSHRRNNSDAFVLPVCKILIEASDADAFYVASFIQNSATRVRLRKYIHQQFVERGRVFLPQKTMYPSLDANPSPEQNAPVPREESTPEKPKEGLHVQQTHRRGLTKIFQSFLDRGKTLLRRFSTIPRAP